MSISFLNQFRMACCKRPNNFDRAKLYKSEDFTEKFALSWDPVNGNITSVKIAAEGHAIVNSPVDPGMSIVCPRFSETASLVDWKLSAEIGKFKLGLNQYFYGHGAFSEFGRQVLFSGVELIEQNLVPRLYLFDLDSFTLHERFEFNFGFPHDILLLEKNIFLVSSGSKDGCGQFVIFDLTSRHFKPIDVNPGSGYDIQGSALVHLKKFENYVYGNWQHTNNKKSDFLGRGCIVKLNLETLQTDFEFPPQFDFIHSEILSLEFDTKRRLLWGTLPAQKKIFVWSIDRKKMVTVIDFAEIVTSISYIPQLDRMLCGQYKNLVLLDCESFKLRSAELGLLSGLQIFSNNYFAHSNFG